MLIKAGYKMSNQKEAARYVLFAISLSVLLFFLALTLPFVSTQGSTIETSQSSSSNLNVPIGQVTYLPRPTHLVTFVAFNGNAPLLWIVGLIFLSLFVGALLRYGAMWGSKQLVKAAWLLSGAVVVAGIVGFFTFLFLAGAAIVPIGLLLLKACDCIAPFRTREAGTI